MLQTTLHYFLHFGFPFLVAWLFFRDRIWKVYLIFIATMLVDLDHLLAVPVFDPCRCSINFHPLHSYWAIGAYFILLLPKQTRIAAIGLLLHMIADGIDCGMMQC